MEQLEFDFYEIEDLRIKLFCFFVESFQRNQNEINIVIYRYSDRLVMKCFKENKINEKVITYEILTSFKLSFIDYYTEILIEKVISEFNE
jgi:hypothetical protein